MSKLPVTIITGFLGSGKTTLLNHILSNNQKLKVAVLVNEFGDIDIDSQLLVSVDENMITLSNGCICCSINQSLIESVEQILHLKEPVDYLIVETTGVADPLPIALTFLSSNLRDFIRLDSILTVVDAENFSREHFESEAALKQIIYGDIIILNKTDLVSKNKLNDLENDLKLIKRGAKIIQAEYGKVPLALLLDLDLCDSSIYEELKQGNHEHHHHSEHLEVDGFVSISFRSDRPFNLAKFQNFFADSQVNNVFRAKGILWFFESKLCHIFQLCGKRYDINTQEWKTEKKNELILIGRNLDIAAIQQGLRECLVELNIC